MSISKLHGANLLTKQLKSQWLLTLILDQLELAHLNLFQYETFFSKHEDPEVRKRGAFLIALIDQLQSSLLVTSRWSEWPLINSPKRMQQLKTQIVLHAIDRHEGNRSKAIKWLGLSRQAFYYILYKWNTVPRNYMKTKLITAALTLLTLTACQTTPIAKTVQPPGNELSMLILQSDFKKVSAEYPEFAAYVISTITRLEIEQAVCKARMFEAQKERREKFPKPTSVIVPPLPPVP